MLQLGERLSSHSSFSCRNISPVCQSFGRSIYKTVSRYSELQQSTDSKSIFSSWSFLISFSLRHSLHLNRWWSIEVNFGIWCPEREAVWNISLVHFKQPLWLNLYYQVFFFFKPEEEKKNRSKDEKKWKSTFCPALITYCFDNIPDPHQLELRN